MASQRLSSRRMSGVMFWPKIETTAFAPRIAPGAQPPVPESLCSVLILEDEMIIGLDIADALASDGYQIAGPFVSSREALAWMETFSPDLGILDVRLRRDSGFAVARELRRRGIPFVFYSGDVGDYETLQGEFPDIPWVDKPAPVAQLKAALAWVRQDPASGEAAEPAGALA